MAFHKTLIGTIGFHFHVNDFENQINRNINLVQFADDTIILCSGNSIKDLRISMLETLEKVHNI